MAEFERKDLAYGGKYHQYGWTKEYCRNATIANCLANCTTLVIMVCQILGLPLPVDAIPDASNWHLNLVNGWKRKAFSRNEVKRGDIIQWISRNHVAIVDKVENGQIYVHASWYTGKNGKSTIKDPDTGKTVYDRRDIFSSLKDVSDFMFGNYPYRTYHYVTLDEEIKGVGGDPENILYLNIAVDPDEEDTNKDQIEITTSVQNARTSAEIRDDNIRGTAKAGYYDVESTTDNDGYIWYRIKDNLYIAGVAGRVKFIPKTQNRLADLKKILNDVQDEFGKLTKENQEYKDLVNTIYELTKPKGE